MIHLVAKHRLALFYGFAFAISLLLLKWLQWQWVFLHSSLELYTGSIAFLFTLLGFWIAFQYTKQPRSEMVTPFIKPPSQAALIPCHANESSIQDLQLSKREIEVLSLMAQGLTNQQIAERLFVSVNTVKTHSSRLFEKMEVSRTQAIDKAKKLRIIE